MEGKPWKVLIIDDDDAIRRILSLSLTDAGYQVRTAPTGNEGLAVLAQEQCDLVITDIRMPGMDGLEVVRRIKELRPDTEVIVVTGYGDMQQAVRALQLDASDFITKPISDAALEVALKRAQARIATRRELRDYTALLEERWMDTAEKLAETYNFQKNLIESSLDGILACDRHGVINTFNRSLEAMLGFSKEEVVGTAHVDSLFAPGEAEKLHQALDSPDYGGRHRLSIYETMLIGKNKAQVPVQLSAAVLFEPPEEPVGMVLCCRDLRDIRRLEQQFADQARLLHQDKMISLGKLAGSVAHEINNPLAGTLNYVRLMRKILEKGRSSDQDLEKFRRYLQVMEEEISRCTRIVANLLAFARKKETHWTRVEINHILGRCLALSEHHLCLQQIKVETRFGSELPSVNADGDQIQQCFLNLIFNAMDAMPAGGTLSIETSFRQRERQVEVRLQDTGCGINPEHLPRIFEPFYTTKTDGKGVGLGLSTVYGIIERHGGDITVSSEPGKGTCFIVRLPAAT